MSSVGIMRAADAREAAILHRALALGDELVAQSSWSDRSAGDEAEGVDDDGVDVGCRRQRAEIAQPATAFDP